MFSDNDLIEVLDALDARGISSLWVDGGWGIDALLGRQTRPHDDLDLAIARADLERAEQTLRGLGFEHDPAREPGMPARFVMVDARGREVDFHPLVFDAEGNGWQQLSASGDAWGCYDGAQLRATGLVAGRSVPCLGAELQVRFHEGYEWGEKDEHDIGLLVREFNLDIASSPR